MHISVEGYTVIPPDQEICAWCEGLNCSTLQHMRTFDSKTPFDSAMILCLDNKFGEAWQDSNKKPRNLNDANKCGRCWKWQAFAPVCSRCADALRLFYNL